MLRTVANCKHSIKYYYYWSFFYFLIYFCHYDYKFLFSLVLFCHHLPHIFCYMLNSFGFYLLHLIINIHIIQTFGILWTYFDSAEGTCKWRLDMYSFWESVYKIIISKKGSFNIIEKFSTAGCLFYLGHSCCSNERFWNITTRLSGI